LSWLYNGRNKSEDQDEADDDDGQAFIGDEEEDIPTSASSAFGHKSQNRHVDPKSSKKQRTQGKVAIVKSTRLTVRAQATIQQLSDHSQHFCAEMDSRADRVCAGSAFRLVDEKVGRVADVAGFHPDMEKMKDIPIVTVATAIDLSHVNETVILVFHEALYFGKRMEESLLNPNQMRAQGIVVDTCPKQFSNGKSMHGIYFPDDDLFLPLRMHGVISYLSTYLPTEHQMETCRWIVMSSEEEWNPYDDKYAKNERGYYNRERGLTDGEDFDSNGPQVIAGETSSRRNPVDPVHLGRR
jgi:hypothetical protein